MSDDNMKFEDTIENVELSQFKWINHIEKLESLAKGKDVFPVTLELDLVSYCNHRCFWCVDPKHMNHNLDRNFIRNILDEAKELGVKGIVFKGGGEPTLSEEFGFALEYAKSKGFETGIVTNGSRLTELAETISDNADYIRISIDGPNEEAHERIHGTKDFNKIIEGVDTLVRLVRKKGSRHPIIGLSFAMDHSMIGNVEEAARLGKNSGVDYILFRPPFFEEVGRENTMSTAEKKELLEKFEAVKNSNTGNMKIFVDYWISDNDAAEFHNCGASPRRGRYLADGSNGIEHSTGSCEASPLLAVISADRKVYPCCNLRFIEGWSLGTIDYDSGINLESIWKSDTRKEVMRKIHCTECIRYCTHPLSKYNEIIEYLKTKRYHGGFI